MERIVASAGKITQDSEELFERIRQNRRDGNIGVRPVVRCVWTKATIGLDEEQYNCSTYYSLPIREDAFTCPDRGQACSICQASRMRRTPGEYPFVRFSRRLLNYLCDRKGSARLSTAFLTTLVTNVHQQNDFKVALRGLNLLRDWTGTYRARPPASTASPTRRWTSSRSQTSASATLGRLNQEC